MSTVDDSDRSQAQVDRDQRAAYILGRHLHALRIWQHEVQFVAIFEEGETWTPPASPWNLYCTAHDAPPLDLFQDLDEALRELAIAKVIDPGVLVELHRLLDGLMQGTEEMAELASIYDREGVSLVSPSNGYQIMLANELSDVAFDADSRQHTWQQFGSAVGDALVDVNEFSQFPTRLPDIRELAERVNLVEIEGTLSELTELRHKCLSLERAGGKPSLELLACDWELRNETAHKVVELDQKVLEVLRGGNEVEPLVVVDRAREELTFLRRRYKFADFPSGKPSCGLKCFIVLAMKPGRPMDRGAILERAGLAAEPMRITEYFSGFRRVVRPAIETYLSDHLRTHSAAKDAFIVSRPSRISKGNEGAYKLDLPPNRVRYIGPDSPASRSQSS